MRGGEGGGVLFSELKRSFSTDRLIYLNACTRVQKLLLRYYMNHRSFSSTSCCLKA